MSGSIIMITSMQTVMLLERVPVLLTRLTVTEPSLSLTITVATSNSMVTTGGITGRKYAIKLNHHDLFVKCIYTI